MTLADFLARFGVQMQCRSGPPNPFMPDRSMHHYRCTLKGPRGKMTIPFSTGSAWTRDPGPKDVLDALASDAVGYENTQGFEEWASEYGFDLDSRKAQRIYRATERQSKALKRIMGDDAYKELLWKTDRE